MNNKKTALELLEDWIEQYYRINGAPTLDDIKGQINLLKDYEREQLHVANVVERSEQACECKKHSIKTSYGFEICTKCGNEWDLVN